jgi:hypothetical protein
MKNNVLDLFSINAKVASQIKLNYILLFFHAIEELYGTEC